MLSNFYFLNAGRTYCSLGGLIEIRQARSASTTRCRSIT